MATSASKPGTLLALALLASLLVVVCGSGVALIVPPTPDAAEGLRLEAVFGAKVEGWERSLVRSPRPAGRRLPYERPLHLPRTEAARLFVLLRLAVVTLGALLAFLLVRRAGQREGIPLALLTAALFVQPGTAVALAVEGGSLAFLAVGFAWWLAWRREGVFSIVLAAVLLVGAGWLHPSGAIAVAACGFGLALEGSRTPTRMRLLAGAGLLALIPLFLHVRRGEKAASAESSPFSPAAMEDAARSLGALFGDLGSQGNPGRLWLLGGLALFGLGVVLAAFRVLRRREHAGMAALLLLGLGGTWVLSCIGLGTMNSGRVLLFPMTLLLAFEARRLLAHRAPLALGFLAGCAALGGGLLVHGSLIPQHAPRDTRETLPGTRLVLDLGSRDAAPFVLRGEPAVERSLGRPDEFRRVVRGPGGPGDAVRIALPQFAATEFQLLSVRVGRPFPHVGLEELGHGRLLLDGKPLGGRFSHDLCADRELLFALPSSAAGVLSLRGAGRQLGLARLVVSALPLRIETEARGEDWVLRCAAVPDAPPQPLRIALLGDGSEPEIELGAHAGMTIGPFPRERTSVRVRLRLEGAQRSRLMAVVCADRNALLSGQLDRNRDLVARRGLPGWFALRLDPARHRELVVLALPPEDLPLHPRRLRLLTAAGEPIPDASFVVELGTERRPIGPEGLALDGRPSGPLRIRYVGSQVIELAIVELEGALQWERRFSRPQTR